MTEGQVQGKWVLVRNNREFEIHVTEFGLAGSNCNPIQTCGVSSHFSQLCLHLHVIICQVSGDMICHAILQVNNYC